MKDVAKHGMSNTCGLLVNSSRGILYAGGAEASREETELAAAAAADALVAQMRVTLQERGLL